MNFYISDLHLGHANCLFFDNRPFKNTKEQDETIINNWNNVVGPDDDVYLLGDISWYDPKKTILIYSKLNGRIHLIKGNHDDKLLQNKDVRNLFVEICDYKELRIDHKYGIVLCHYPIPCFRNHLYGWYHFYGHVHTGFEDDMMDHVKYQMKALYDKPCNMINIGCMKPYMDYTPRSFDELKSQFQESLIFDTPHA